MPCQATFTLPGRADVAWLRTVTRTHSGLARRAAIV